MGVTILLTRPDMVTLGDLLEQQRRWPGLDRDQVETLRRKVDDARVVRSEEIPADVVTLHSRVGVRHLDDGPYATYRLVMPVHASTPAGTISVLSSIGAAMLGRRQGDEIEYAVPGGVRRLKVENIPYQPEAAEHRSRRFSANDAAKQSIR